MQKYVFVIFIRFLAVLWIQAGPALAGAGPNARPRRRATEQLCYYVIVFGQPCYDNLFDDILVK